MPSWPSQSVYTPRSNVGSSKSQLRIIVLGYIVRGPIGGMAWHHLNYVLGLRRLGHDVLFLEDSDDYPSCYDPSTHQVHCDPTYGLKFAKDVFDRLGLDECWAYYDAHQNAWHGPVGSRASNSCADADMLLNLSGINPIRSWLEDIPVRVLVDTDPAFTQIRHLNDEHARSRAQQHNRFFTFAESIRSPDCEVPDDGFLWEPTRQPIVLDAWPIGLEPGEGSFTTVMQWDSYSALQHAGKRFGMKSDSFDLIRNLPSRVEVSLELALGGKYAPRDDLSKAGWRIVDPLAVTRDPWTYQKYLRGSLGEFSVAKHGYVASRSGWFSERSACYLAAGRPAIVQDTGFSQHLPCGSGLWAFHDLESAIDSLSNATMNPRKQRQAARELAVAYFDSNKVLTKLIDRVYSTTARLP